MPWTPEQRLKYAQPDRRKRNKPIDRARQQAYYKKHKSKTIRENWRRQIEALGCTEAKYFQLFADQGGVCAICGGINSDGRKLAVDHNHNTGEIRGLLCQLCNPGLGLFKDSSELLKKAVEYLCRTIK